MRTSGCANQACESVLRDSDPAAMICVASASPTHTQEIAMSIYLLPAGAFAFGHAGCATSLGTIILCLIDSLSLDHVGEALDLHAHLPWCPIVLASPAAHSPGTLERFSPRGSQFSAIQHGESGELPTPHAVRTAVAQRPLISQDQFLGYLRCRLGDEMGRAAAGACFDHLERRTVKKATRYPPGVWERLWEVVLGASLAFRERMTLEQLAEVFEYSPRHASTWGPKRVGMPWRDVRELCCWEAVCESGLRMLGLTSEAPARRPRVSGEFLSVLPARE